MFGGPKLRGFLCPGNRVGLPGLHGGLGIQTVMLLAMRSRIREDRIRKLTLLFGEEATGFPFGRERVCRGRRPT